MNRITIIEGIDRLGKNTLIDGIINACGFYQEIHFSKPKRLDAYQNCKSIDGVPPGTECIYHYQYQSFLNAMIMIRSGARIIFNRSWIGEAVYSPIYREIDGNYVFDLEKKFNIEDQNIRLILLIEDFSISRHFVDDGESLGTIDKREEEQHRFMDAFTKSIIRDKRMICVTSQDGGFRSKEDILADALADPEVYNYA